MILFGTTRHLLPILPRTPSGGNCRPPLITLSSVPLAHLRPRLLPAFFAVCCLRCGTFDRNHRHRRPCAKVLELNQSRQPSPPDSSSYPNSLPDPLTETLQQIGGGFSLESRQRGIFRDQQAQRTLQVYGVSTVRAMGSSFPCTCTSATGRELSFPHCTHARICQGAQCTPLLTEAVPHARTEAHAAAAHARTHR